jgi:hypothetical protein
MKQDTRRQIFGVAAITGGFRVFLDCKIDIKVSDVATTSIFRVERVT